MAPFARRWNLAAVHLPQVILSQSKRQMITLFRIKLKRLSHHFEALLVLKGWTCRLCFRRRRLMIKHLGFGWWRNLRDFISFQKKFDSLQSSKVKHQRNLFQKVLYGWWWLEKCRELLLRWFCHSRKRRACRCNFYLLRFWATCIWSRNTIWAQPANL